MQVFSAYFRIVKRLLPQLMIYVCVFMGLAIVFTFMNGDSAETTFTATSMKVAVVERDAPSPLVDGLKASLATRHTLVDLPDDPQQLQDALYYRDVQYIIIVPEGYAAAFAAGQDVKLDTALVPDSAGAYYVTGQIDQYVRLMRTYQRACPHLSQQEQADAALRALSTHADVSLVQRDSNLDSGVPAYSYYYNYLAYVMLALVLMVVSTIQMLFGQSDLYRRNLCAPLSVRRLDGQLMLGNLVFSIACWALLVLCSFVLYGGSLLTSALLPLLLLNSLVYTIVCVGLSYLLGQLVKSAPAQSAMLNIVTLGMSFLCGVFVPQEVMSPAVLKAAQFLPTYWYVHANNDINALSALDGAHIWPILSQMGIQLAFAIALFCLALLLSKRRRTSNA